MLLPPTDEQLLEREQPTIVLSCEPRQQFDVHVLERVQLTIVLFSEPLRQADVQVLELG